MEKPVNSQDFAIFIHQNYAVKALVKSTVLAVASMVKKKLMLNNKIAKRKMFFINFSLPNL